MKGGVANNSGNDHDNEADSESKVLKTLNKYIKTPKSPYPRSHQKCIDYDRSLGIMITLDLRPLSDCDSLELEQFIHTMDI